MCFDGRENPYVDGPERAQLDVHRVSSAPLWKSARLIAAVLGAASLAACAQSTISSQRSELGASRQSSLQQSRSAWVAMKKRVAATRKHTRLASRGGSAKVASQGVASFYSEDGQTASGEKFDKNELTAAHPSLPFGTRLRVTDVKTGRSVTVRVNDRGPYVHGRIVDVSYSAAQELGMVGKGVANVRLDVLH